jgi:hypothetical protein
MQTQTAPPVSRPATSAAPARRATSRTRLQPATSFLDIFDWKFEKYLTPWVIRATWIICLILAAAMLVMSSVETFRDSLPERPATNGIGGRVEFRLPEEPPSDRALTLLAGLAKVLAVIIAVLWVRVVMETTIVLFNIATTLTTIDRRIETEATARTRQN